MRIRARINCVRLIASGLGSGFSPYCPGTVGSVTFCLLWLAVFSFPLLAFLKVIPSLILISVGGYIALKSITLSLRFIGPEQLLQKAHRSLGNDANVDHRGHSEGSLTSHIDPQWIVIDEWIGLLVPLAALGVYDLGTICLTCFVFRIFDITKGGGISRLERLPGAWGILMDDVGAGVYTTIVLYLFSLLERL
jgi:phosphatidylglycerophosphatase A